MPTISILKSFHEKPADISNWLPTWGISGWYRMYPEEEVLKEYFSEIKKQ
jgi:hypothetical protein